MIDVGTLVNQGAAPHGGHTLGGGPKTIRQSGCLLACLVMVARARVGPLDLDVLRAHARVLAAGGFAGSALLVTRAARALDLAHDDAFRGSFDSALARAELAAGRPVIVGVDYKPGRSSGLSDADHFVVLVDGDARNWAAADPNGGRLIAVPHDGFHYSGRPARLCELLRFR